MESNNEGVRREYLYNSCVKGTIPIPSTRGGPSHQTFETGHRHEASQASLREALVQTMTGPSAWERGSGKKSDNARSLAWSLNILNHQLQASRRFESAHGTRQGKRQEEPPPIQRQTPFGEPSNRLTAFKRIYEIKRTLWTRFRTFRGM
jgi:hypothetical protein